MANAVTGDTTPNYFKEILVFLYPRFGNAEQYSLEVIIPNFKNLSSSEKKNIQSFIALMSKQNIISNMRAGEKSYQLDIQGFEFCQKHKDYLGIKS